MRRALQNRAQIVSHKMSGTMEPVLFYYGSSFELHGYLDCYDTVITQGSMPVTKDGCKIVGAWTGVDLSAMNFPVHGPFGEDPMVFYMSSDEDSAAVEPASYHEEDGYSKSSTETTSYPQQDPEANSLLNAEDIKLLKEIEQSTLILGIAIGFCAVLAVSIIAFMLYRRYRRRAMDRGRPRPLPPPSVGAPAPSRRAVKGEDARNPQTPAVVTGGINPENVRVWEALVALRNEIREMREGDTTETLPEYEPQDQRPHS